MFDTVLNRIIVFLSVLVLILGLFIAGLFVPPVFALDYQNIYSINNNTYSVGSYSTIVSYGTNLGLNSSVNSNVYYYAQVSEVNTYSTFVGFYLDNGSKQAVALVSDYPSNSVMYFYSATDRYGGTGNGNATARYSSDYGVHYGLFSTGYYCPDDVYYFDSLDSLLSNFVNGDSFTPLYDGFNLPRGYLARITFRDSSSSDNNSITLTSTFGNKSNAITGRFNSSQWYRFINTDLASVVLQYESLGTKISWSPFGHHTTLGQYENGSFSLSGSSSTQLWVVNPVYQSYQINSLGAALAGHGLNGVLNNNVVINDPNGIIEQIRIFPLSSGLVAGVDGVVNETDEDAYRDVNGSTSGAFTFTDSNGNITGSVPENGATLVDDTTASSLDILNTIKNAFNDLINRLESIFHPAQGFFNTILGSFNDFVHWLSQLWSWLPSPIVSLIEAVLYISILVGCIKLVF